MRHASLLLAQGEPQAAQLLLGGAEAALGRAMEQLGGMEAEAEGEEELEVGWGTAGGRGAGKGGRRAVKRFLRGALLTPPPHPPHTPLASPLTPTTLTPNSSFEALAKSSRLGWLRPSSMQRFLAWRRQRLTGDRLKR